MEALALGFGFGFGFVFGSALAAAKDLGGGPVYLLELSCKKSHFTVSQEPKARTCTGF